VLVQYRVGDHGDDQSDEPADDRPEGKHHADEHESQVELEPRGHRRQDSLGMAGQLDPGIGIRRMGSVKIRPETVGRST
jgi:hypothetical protein